MGKGDGIRRELWGDWHPSESGTRSKLPPVRVIDSHKMTFPKFSRSIRNEDANVHRRTRRDETTFAPFVLIDQRDSEWKDVRLQFDSWETLHKAVGVETNSEGGMHFGDLDTAVQTASLAQAEIGDLATMKRLAAIAVDEGFDDI
ncbi:MAG: hypothetical protein AAF802_19310 [Planctomycetota bacterium]